MPFTDATILRAFASDEGFLTKEGADLPGLDQAIDQVDDIIYQKTLIKAPEDPAEAPGKLRNIACALVVWFTTGMQGKLGEEEIARRKKMYDDAMAELDAIQSGRSPLFDSSGTAISTRPQSYFSSTQRITDPL